MDEIHDDKGNNTINHIAVCLGKYVENELRTQGNGPEGIPRKYDKSAGCWCVVVADDDYAKGNIVACV